jgi:predicted AAA+ superfamily ATPase
MLHLAALRSRQIIKVSELGRDARFHASTLSRCLKFLEAPFVIRRTGPFLSNRGSRLIKCPKLYPADPGRVGHLAGVDATAPRGDPP